MQRTYTKVEKGVIIEELPSPIPLKNIQEENLDVPVTPVRNIQEYITPGPDWRTVTTKDQFGSSAYDATDAYIDLFGVTPVRLNHNDIILVRTLVDYKKISFSFLVKRDSGKGGQFSGFLFNKELKLCLKWWEKSDYCMISELMVDVSYYTDTKYKSRIDAFLGDIKDNYARKAAYTPKMKIIVPEQGGLDTRSVDLDPNVPVDIDKHYNDDFKPIYETIIQRLNKQKDKGLVLLHGKPGTAKTTLVRHLTTQIKDKPVIFLPNSLAAQLASPNMLGLFLENKNSVIVIEDAEDLLTDRGSNYNKEGVSNLLNVADGLLSDVLNIQIICTFNCNLNLIDKALLRKGRLIAKYEFTELSVDKSNALLKELGKDYITKEPMCITDIFNFDDAKYTNKERPKIGFR